MVDNLKCSVCNKKATVHLTQIVNNKIHKVDLCASCAQKKGVTNSEGFSLVDLLSKTSLETMPDQKTPLVCATCGQETADFRRTGRLGCANCYEVFKSFIFPVLEDMHAGTRHKGKVPTSTLSHRSNQLKLQNLRDSMVHAIAEEAYEEAAKFRDQIKALEQTEQLEVTSK